MLQLSQPFLLTRAITFSFFSFRLPDQIVVHNRLVRSSHCYSQRTATWRHYFLFSIRMRTRLLCVSARFIFWGPFDTPHFSAIGNCRSSFSWLGFCLEHESERCVHRTIRRGRPEGLGRLSGIFLLFFLELDYSHLTIKCFLKCVFCF